jgi:hypothetical protein
MHQLGELTDGPGAIVGEELLPGQQQRLLVTAIRILEDMV